MGRELKLNMKTALAQVLSPQMQESLAILASPILELRNKVNEELEKNPVLELDEDAPAPAVKGDLADPVSDQEAPHGSVSTSSTDDYGKRMGDLIETEEGWKDYFLQGESAAYTPSRSDNESRQYFFDSITNHEQSLQSFLLEQADSMDLPPEKREVVELLIGYIDDQGYLRSKPMELVFATNRSPEEIQEALELFHRSFDPPGVAARDLRECLLIQLERAGQKESLEWKIVDRFLPQLEMKRFTEIASRLNRSVEAVKEAVKRIGQLEPKPGRPFFSGTNVYVAPEVFVEKDGDHYKVTMNDDLLPKLKINKIYKEMMGASESKETRAYIMEKIRSGRGFITSLEQRQRTIRKVAEVIVDFQKDFMEKGVSGLRPLSMQQVADVAGVHITTVSRAIAGKYMQTPQGVFDMHYFFNSALKNDSGEAVANAQVKAALQEMISKEDKKHPLTDQQLMELFRQRGINVARRTIAKYRSMLGYENSPRRREY